MMGGPAVSAGSAIGGVVLGVLGFALVLLGVAGLFLPVVPGMLLLVVGAYVIAKARTRKRMKNKEGVVS